MRYVLIESQLGNPVAFTIKACAEIYLQAFGGKLITLNND